MTGTWATSTVGEQFDMQLGKMLDAAKNFGVPKPYLGNRAVQWGRIDVSVGGVVPLTRADLTRYRLRENDLLVCEGGEVGRAAIWRNQLPECYFQKALHRLRPKRGYDARVMQALLQYWSSTGAFSDYVTQTSIAHLPREKFSLMPMPLPSVAEQRRIGDALQHSDDLITALERLIVKKQAIKQGMMQQLLTGRIRLPGFSLPWNEIHLGDVGQSFIGLTYSPANVKRSGTLVLRSSNIQDGYLSLADNVFVDSPIPSRIRVRENDILICVRNGSRSLIGKSVMLDSRVVGQTFGAFMAVYRSPLNPFLRYFFQSDRFKRQIDEHLGATINQITNASLNSFVADMPNDPAEQAAIGGVLADAESEIAKLRARLGKARDIKTGMMQQLLTGRTRLPMEASS